MIKSYLKFQKKIICSKDWVRNKPKEKKIIKMYMGGVWKPEKLFGTSVIFTSHQQILQ